MPAASELIKPEPNKTINLEVKHKSLEGVNLLTQKTYNIRVHYWMTVIELKEKIFKENGLPVASQRLFARNCELENNKTLESYNVLHKGKNKVVLIQRRPLEGRNSFIEPYGNIQK